jgi:hypothetical protein
MAGFTLLFFVCVLLLITSAGLLRSVAAGSIDEGVQLSSCRAVVVVVVVFVVVVVVELSFVVAP